jgi:hypothetical protein
MSYSNIAVLSKYASINGRTSSHRVLTMPDNLPEGLVAVREGLAVEVLDESVLGTGVVSRERSE